MSGCEEKCGAHTLKGNVTGSIKAFTRFAFGNQNTETRQVYSSFCT